MKRLLAALAAGLVCAGSAVWADTPLSFDGAQLGITLGAWRSLATPPGAGPTAQAACSNDPRIVHIAHNPLSAAEAPGDAVTCGYMSVFGDDVLPHSVRLDAAFRATNPLYVFVKRRLSEIRFGASVDAYDDVMAQFKSLYGPPTQTAWDQIRTSAGKLRRVRQTWRLPQGRIELTDPGGDLTGISVEIAGPAPDATPGPATRSVAANAPHQPG